ncbi:MAG: FtsK/SpoIIIE domain-containing protein, partial [Microbacterium sp.]
MTAPLRADEPLSLPAPTAPARRGSIPIVASLVPVVGAVVMWLVTGYVMMLCFAAIGPLMAVGSLVDGARARRRDRRRAAQEMAAACERARGELRERHDAERDALDRRRPDAGRLAAARTLWRHGTEQLVLGRGRVPSETRVTGGEGEEADRLRRDAAWVGGAPVSAALSEAGGVCVQGPAPAARAVARAFLIQLCLRASPERLRVTRVLPGDRAALAALPHLGADGASRAAPPAAAAPVRVAVVDAAADARGAQGEAPDFVICVAERGVPAPPACGVLIELDEAGALVGRRLDDTASDPSGEPLELEALSLAQAERIAAELAARRGAAADAAPVLCELSEILAAPEAGGRPADDGPAGLAVPIGRAAAGLAGVDLVHDGPHAVVVGMTGSGKSELLTTWICALAATRSTDEVAFLLADFKGGTAFASLEDVPHVTGLITDLDGSGSRRAVESLRAELRRREAAIAGAGAADIADPRVDMPRLVIVVDEFGAPERGPRGPYAGLNGG